MVACVALTHYVHAALSYLIDTLCNEMCNNSARKKSYERYKYRQYKHARCNTLQ